MAVEKVFRCDLCGEYVAAADVRVLRVGTTADRPEACDRVDTGPECDSRPIGDALANAAAFRKQHDSGD